MEEILHPPFYPALQELRYCGGPILQDCLHPPHGSLVCNRLGHHGNDPQGDCPVSLNGADRPRFPCSSFTSSLDYGTSSLLRAVQFSPAETSAQHHYKKPSEVSSLGAAALGTTTPSTKPSPQPRAQIRNPQVRSEILPSTAQPSKARNTVPSASWSGECLKIEAP